jgi:hypothetical protein
MTCGIYKLKFNNTDKCYIGKSKNIEIRFIYHKYKITHGLASKKLLDAYRLYGMPSLDILCECSECDLDTYEKEAISIYNSVDYGFNTLKEGAKTSSINGERHHNSVNNDENVFICLVLLAEKPNKTLKEISDISNTTYSTVCDISKGVSHTWLKDVMPKEYEAMLSYKYSRKILANKTGPVILVNKDGVDYEVTNIREFSRLHNLGQSHLGRVINGKAKQHKGWKLKDTNECKCNCSK